MSRKGRSEAGRKGAIIRVSVGLSDDVHQRLRALSLIRRVPAAELVAGWVEREVGRVRLPAEMASDASPADPAA